MGDCMFRVLHTLPALDGGGAEKIVYDYVSRMLDDFSFDFITHSKYKGLLEEKLLEKGCRIYHIPPLHEDKKKYKDLIYRVIKDGHYDIIHVSQGYRGLYFLYCAKKLGVKVRIAHSHMANIPESFKERVVRKISTFLAKKYATCFFACSEAAGKWMWGKFNCNISKNYIMINGINASDYSFSLEEREKVRCEYGFQKTDFVIGAFARFTYQKNHEFLIRIFSCIKKNMKNAKLLLLGNGELEEEIRKAVSDSHLDDSVIFGGVREDANKVYNALDLFLLPSRFEGLGIVFIEAQANGLMCITSNQVPKESNILGLVSYLPLEKEPEEWAEAILQMNIERKTVVIDSFQYDINYCVSDLSRYYKEQLGER